MNRATVIAMVKDATEHRADQRITWEDWFGLRLQKFCQEKPYWWRHRVCSFNTAPGVGLYDLSSTASGLPGINDLENIISVSLWSNGLKQGALDPCFDLDAISGAQEDTTTDQPVAYAIEPSTLYTLRLIKIPNSVWKVKITYYAIPNPNDNTNDTIPLVPDIYHAGLVAGLKMDVTGFLYGVESKAYEISQSEYLDCVSKAQARTNFGPTELIQFVIPDDAIASNVGNV